MREDDSNWFAGWEKELPSQLQLPSSQANSRVVWSQQLHERFLDAVEHLGINHAVPKRIMEFMDVDGLTRVEVRGVNWLGHPWANPFQTNMGG